MTMDIESLGSGAGAGLIGAVLGVLGITRKVNKLENDKQDKSACIPMHKSIDEKFTIVIDGQKRLFERLDSINDYLRNGK
jgi:hypothetical protein